MNNITPNTPSSSTLAPLQDRFNRDTEKAIKQISIEAESRLSDLEYKVTALRTDLNALILEWRDFYDVEWPEQTAIIASNTSRIEALEAAAETPAE